MRSILVTIDDTPSTVTAWKIAASFARQRNAAVKGVTGVELTDIEAAEPFPIGGVQYAYDRLEHRAKRTKQRRDRMAEMQTVFQRRMADEGIKSECLTIEKDVRANILRMAETCDLVVAGRDSEFHLDPVEGITPLVEHIVAKGCRPVLVSGPMWADKGPILVAYDGSAAAAKALQLAVFLGLFQSCTAHVLSISPQRATAAENANRAMSFLGVHGVAAEAEVIETAEHPARAILDASMRTSARLLVMGAFGHRGIREMLFGSTTRRLFDHPPLPLFIYH